ncbi:MAG: T9SS type A sorting domain-containing protein [Flavobacteriales bacterium]|nr:T9SS type A sorting domain-containing protein [Flavobacteriales bacterium]
MERATLIIGFALGMIPASGQFTVLHTGAAGSSLEAIDFPTPMIGYAVGKDGAAYKSMDSGENWTPLSTGSDAYLFGVHFIDADFGFVSGGGATVLRTADGGTSWTPLTPPFTECIYQVQPITASLVYAAGWGGYFFRSTDGGDDWTIASIDPNWQGWVFGMHFRDELNGVVAQTDGRIYRSDDGGLNWTQSPTATSNALRGISMGDATTGFAAGFFGTVQKTVNGGANWSTVNTGYPGDSYYGVHFTDALNGVICGGYYAGSWQGVILRTDDGGTSWDRIHTGGPVLNGITINDGHIFAVGTNEVIVSDLIGTGTTDLSDRMTISASPIPAADHVVIRSIAVDGGKLEVRDAVGRLVLSGVVLSTSEQVDVSTWETGAYTVRITMAGVEQRTRFVVVR